VTINNNNNVATSKYGDSFFSKYGEFATKKQINPRKSFLAFAHEFFLFLFCCQSAKFGFFFLKEH
jgi:hypothetical protein